MNDCLKQANDSSFQNLKILSFNIQVGIDSSRYSDYIKNSWRHVLPHAERHANLKKIAQLLSQYDLVALQEVDAGSLRSSNINQVKFLAEQAHFPHWYVQQNRNLGRIAAHANGLITKMSANKIIQHTLPGMIPGRGALQVNFGSKNQMLSVIVAHLALGKKARKQQLNYIAQSLCKQDYFILMGDMNCEPQQVADELANFGLASQLVDADLLTYPSWNPKKALDQIIVSEYLEITKVNVVNELISDHLPIEMEIRLPKSLAKQIELREALATLQVY